jgi:serine/threonine protein kinase
VLIKEIGRGGFGKVKLAINQKTSEHVAIKIANKNKLKKKLLNKGKSAFTQLQTEIAIMKKLVSFNFID